nr:MAG TPA_asm: hypothetical protein [Caudoviricetes sp.]
MNCWSWVMQLSLRSGCFPTQCFKYREHYRMPH